MECLFWLLVFWQRAGWRLWRQNGARVNPVYFILVYRVPSSYLGIYIIIYIHTLYIL